MPSTNICTAPSTTTTSISESPAEETIAAPISQAGDGVGSCQQRESPVRIRPAWLAKRSGTVEETR